MTVGGQHDADRRLHLQRFPDPVAIPQPTSSAAIAHGARRGIALLPTECLRALAIAFTQLLAGVRQVLVLIAIRIAPQAEL